MSLIILGMSHKTAPIKVRETLALSEYALTQQLKSLYEQSYIYEVAILSTCNRTEWILHLDEKYLAQVETQLMTSFSIEQTDWHKSLYRYYNLSAVEHLIKVACGLDSMVLGEPQILGQLKRAYTIAKDCEVIAEQSERLFQLTFSTAKKVRTETAIGKDATSVALIAVRLAKQIFEDISKVSVLMIGAGDTIARVAKHLKENQVENLIILNRTLEHAQQLVEQVGGQAGHIAELPMYLKHVNVVITSTASNLPIIGKGMIESMQRLEKRRPIVMIDLAVPRDIEPEVAELKDIYLYCIDDLQKVAEDNIKNREAAAQQAEAIILDAVSSYHEWLKSLDAVDIIRSYRREMDQLLHQELSRALKQLDKHEEPDTIIRHFGKRLSNKMMHKICCNMRQAGRQGKTNLLKSAKSLLEIQE